MDLCRTRRPPRPSTLRPGCGRSWAGSPSRAPTLSSRSVGGRSPILQGSSRPPGCAGSGSSTSRRRSWPWWTRRSGERLASTPPRARTSSAPSMSRWACSAISTCCRHCPKSTSPRGWPRSSRPDSSPTPGSWNSCTRIPARPGASVRPPSNSSSAPLPSRPQWSRPTCARRGCARFSTTDIPSGTPSSSTRHTPCGTGRRWPWAWCSPPNWRTARG